MARIVLGMATSHGPLLSTPPDQWWQRGLADRNGHFELFFKGGLHSFDDLVKLRADEHVEHQLEPELMAQRHEACQTSLAELSATVKRVAPDVAVVIGDDQHESFLDDNMPAFAVYWGDSVQNVPLTAEQSARRAPGESIADWGQRPPVPMTHPGEPGLGRHIIGSLMQDEFDVAHSCRLPAGRWENYGISHAFGFIYRRIMNDEVIPHVPVFINTFYPPNQPSLKRCYAFGQALRRAIESWPESKTVAVIASGGLSHFVVEEDVDQQFLDALQAEDAERICNLPAEFYNGGTSEARNWIATAGAMAGTDLHVRLLDYIPCYRSEAGTGNAMGFAQWL
ncbi:MAG: protocatechuate 3,4-dioxygenase [Chloroflexi bacterium]|nr:protocatechuate 3,4-dioxygenase [Chloroflexota bacterium]